MLDRWQGHERSTIAMGVGLNRSISSSMPFRPSKRRKIDDYIEEHLNGQALAAPPPEFPISSQIEGELRELRIRFANTRYRILYQRSGGLIVLLHAFEKNTGAVPASEKSLAKRRMADFRRRMDARPRTPPRAAGKDAPSPRS